MRSRPRLRARGPRSSGWSMPRLRRARGSRSRTSRGLLTTPGLCWRSTASRRWAAFLVETDRWEIDAIYSGSQKCLGAPPGLAPVTLGPRAVEALSKRKTKVQSWYFDLSVLQNYWGTRSVLPPHRADQHELCAAGSAGAGRGRRPRSPNRPARAERPGASGGGCRDGPEPGNRGGPCLAAVGLRQDS